MFFALGKTFSKICNFRKCIWNGSYKISYIVGTLYNKNCKNPDETGDAAAGTGKRADSGRACIQWWYGAVTFQLWEWWSGDRFIYLVCAGLWMWNPQNRQRPAGGGESPDFSGQLTYGKPRPSPHQHHAASDKLQTSHRNKCRFSWKLELFYQWVSDSDGKHGY